MYIVGFLFGFIYQWRIALIILAVSPFTTFLMWKLSQVASFCISFFNTFFKILNLFVANFLLFYFLLSKYMSHVQLR